MGVLSGRIKARIGATASMAESVNTMPWYHGTKNPTKISNFRIGRRGAAYFSADIGHARVYGPHIFEVDLSVKKVWDFNNPDDVALIMPALRSMPNYEPWMEKELRIGDWEILEMRPVREALRSNGYDSYFVSGDGQSIGVLDRSAVSVARDFWVDRLGEEVPKEETMSVEASLGVAAASDAEYLAAAESGDIEKCQAMVDAAAKAAGYTIGPVYHGTKAKFNEFVLTQQNDAGWLGAGFYFYGDRAEAAQYGPTNPYYLKIEDIHFINEDEHDRLVEGNDPEASKLFSKEVMDYGHDGAFYNGDLRQEYVVFSPNQIKSADPIVHDDAGNIIPLSKRFHSASNDIRAAKIKAEGRRYKSGLEDYVLHSDIVGDITVEKMARKIEQKKLNSDKDELFNSVMGSVNQTLLNHMILTLPSGAYLLHTKGRAAPLIGDVIMEKYGVWAGTCVDEKVLRGLAALFPERISVSFTHGLEEISIKDSENRKMNLQEKYKALKASGKIPATGRTEEILAEDDWVRVKKMAVPEIDADSYIFTECKRETAVCIVRDADGRYLMRNEATLQSNFTPAPKVMTETLEEGETAEDAAYRGMVEEFGIENLGDAIYLGSINGTFQELHNYHIFLFSWSDTPIGFSDDFEGDGSRGEDRSNNVAITEEEWAQVKDFISWIAYGMMKQYDNRNILGRTLCL